ncbi:hypothetical protein ACRAWD_18050 [Caulobacter segnis]
MALAAVAGASRDRLPRRCGGDSSVRDQLGRGRDQPPSRIVLALPSASVDEENSA